MVRRSRFAILACAAVLALLAACSSGDGSPTLPGVGGGGGYGSGAVPGSNGGSQAVSSVPASAASAGKYGIAKWTLYWSAKPFEFFTIAGEDDSGKMHVAARALPSYSLGKTTYALRLETWFPRRMGVVLFPDTKSVSSSTMTQDDYDLFKAVQSDLQSASSVGSTVSMKSVPYNANPIDCSNAADYVALDIASLGLLSQTCVLPPETPPPLCQIAGSITDVVSFFQSCFNDGCPTGRSRTCSFFLFGCECDCNGQDPSCVQDATDCVGGDVVMTWEMPRSMDPNNQAATTPAAGAQLVIQQIPDFQKVQPGSSQFQSIVQALSQPQFAWGNYLVQDPAGLLQHTTTIHMANQAIRCGNGVTIPMDAQGNYTYAMGDFPSNTQAQEVSQQWFAASGQGSNCLTFEAVKYARDIANRSGTYSLLASASADHLGLDEPNSGADIQVQVCCDGTTSVVATYTAYAEWQLDVGDPSNGGSSNIFKSGENVATYLQNGGTVLTPANMGNLDSYASVPVGPPSGGVSAQYPAAVCLAESAPH
jgi:hypothetical protein